MPVAMARRRAGSMSRVPHQGKQPLLLCARSTLRANRQPDDRFRETRAGPWAPLFDPKFSHSLLAANAYIGVALSDVVMSILSICCLRLLDCPSFPQQSYGFPLA